MFQFDQESNKFINTIAIMLIVLALMLAYASNTFDFSLITDPIEIIQDEAQNTISGQVGNIGITQENGNDNTVIAGTRNEISSKIMIARGYYESFRSFMENVEMKIASYDNKIIIVIALLLFFASKSIISIVPLSVTCLISGMVFPFPIALLINYLGVSSILIIKYFWGKKLGQGNVSKIMRHSKTLARYIEDSKDGDGTGNPIILFILRLVPSVPLNPISQMYGNMGYDLVRYMIISLGGLSVKIVSFTALGVNASNPLSHAFAIPLIIIMLVSGIGMLTMSLVISRTRKKQVLES
ncbi:MAG: VTT domain-containing protein [Oscillospiraceae bacterium]|nr:VTT domain-containing protein [Oscillospiraceae bacterium]